MTANYPFTELVFLILDTQKLKFPSHYGAVCIAHFLFPLLMIQMVPGKESELET